RVYIWAGCCAPKPMVNEPDRLKAQCRISKSKGISAVRQSVPGAEQAGNGVEAGRLFGIPAMNDFHQCPDVEHTSCSLRPLRGCGMGRRSLVGLTNSACVFREQSTLVPRHARAPRSLSRPKLGLVNEHVHAARLDVDTHSVARPYQRQ